MDEAYNNTYCTIHLVPISNRLVASLTNRKAKRPKANVKQTTSHGQRTRVNKPPLIVLKALHTHTQKLNLVNEKHPPNN